MRAIKVANALETWQKKSPGAVMLPGLVRSRRCFGYNAVRNVTQPKRSSPVCEMLDFLGQLGCSRQE